MELLSTIFWLFVAHFIADYPLQNDRMGKYKNKRNPPPPPTGAQPVPVWVAFLTAHAFIHAGLVALVVGVPLGFIYGITHWIQDYLKCKYQYSSNIDQGLHLLILVIIAILTS